MRTLATLAAATTLALTGCLDDGHDEDTELFEQAHEENLGEGKADSNACSGVRVPDRSGFGKRIALTFDDGPHPVTTPQVIAVLERHGAPATFFINGSRFGTAGAKELAARIAAHPNFILANHSHSHKNLAQQSAAVVASEISKTDALIRAAGEMPVYFRFPFGSSTCNTMRQARDQGYIVAGWHIDSADWCYAAGSGTCKASTFRYVPDQHRGSMLGYVRSQVHATGGGILLFHDVHANTASSLDAILTALKADGYTFVRLDNREIFPRLHAPR